MNGKIYFDTLMELAEFLKEYSGSNTFEARKLSSGIWMFEFTGD